MKVYIVLVLFLSTVFSKTCDITTYGAKGDGKTDNTKAIQQAVTDCKSGGIVLIPAPGIFVSYPILSSGAQSLTIQIQKGASLQAGPISGWPVSDGTYVNFLELEHCTNCVITGGGLIDGQGTPWYIAFDQGKLTYNRPVLVIVKHATNFKLINVNILNAPMFNVVLQEVIGGEVAYLNITDQWYNNGTMEPHNTDGIDPGSNSQDIHIHDCYIYNGDDSVAIKPGTIAGGCTKNILVENCYFSHGHGASIGSISTGCIQDVVFRNITMVDQLNGINIKSFNAATSGWVKNITWEQITMTSNSHCIRVNTNYHPPKGPGRIVVSDITMTDVKGTDCGVSATFLCQETNPCTQIQLDNVNVALGQSHPMACSYAEGTSTNVLPKSCLTGPSATFY